MTKGISAALLVVGIVLTIWGARASQTFSSEVTEALTGAPSDRAIWLLLAGIASGVLGLFGLLRAK